MGEVWSTTFGSFLSCYNFVPNEIWQHNSCSNYSNWLQRVQDDHVISCFMGERSPPSPYFHASVVFKGVLQRTVKQSTSTWVLNTVHKGWLVNLETKSNCHKKKNTLPFFLARRSCHVGALAEPEHDERGCNWQRDNSFENVSFTKELQVISRE